MNTYSEYNSVWTNGSFLTSPVSISVTDMHLRNSDIGFHCYP